MMMTVDVGHRDPSPTVKELVNFVTTHSNDSYKGNEFISIIVAIV